MPIAEPMTMATDYILGALGLWLGYRLWSLAAPGDARRWWAVAFWVMALAAVLGGSAHGFAPMLGDTADALIWRASMVLIGAVAVVLVYASIVSVGESACGGWSRWVAWPWVLAAEFLAYSVWVCWVDSEFRYAVVQYGSALLVVLLIHGVLAARRRPGALTVVVGILVSFAAAWIQQSGLSLHTHFNHNDLYHVVQMVGMYLLYRGAVLCAATEHSKPT